MQYTNFNGNEATHKNAVDDLIDFYELVCTSYGGRDKLRRALTDAGHSAHHMKTLERAYKECVLAREQNRQSEILYIYTDRDSNGDSSLSVFPHNFPGPQGYYVGVTIHLPKNGAPYFSFDGVEVFSENEEENKIYFTEPFGRID